MQLGNTADQVKISLNYSMQFLLLIACISFNYDSHAWQLLNNEIDISCSQTGKLLLACSYRPLAPDTIKSVSARFADQSLDIGTHNPYPAPDSVTAVLLLVDTSDPARNNVVRKNIRQIVRMIESAGTRHRIGLASFDKDLVMHVPFGGNKTSLIEQAETLRAAGMTTELFRSALEAIDLLSATNADRKVIFMFSDGLAEDIAYFHQDVVAAAREHGVIINTLGFARTPALTVALQTLRRLSNETGGIFIESNTNFDLPTAFLNNPYVNIDTGGQFVVDLGNIDNHRSESFGITAVFETTGGKLPVMIPVNLPAGQIMPAPYTLRPDPIADRPVQPAAQPAPAGTVKMNWLWYGVPAALLISILLSLTAIYLLYRKQPATGPVVVSGIPRQKPLAYLINQRDHATLYPVTSPLWRIGRGKENEMALNDSSISRRHAEIHRLDNGKFVLYDCGSTNGVFVNNRKITEQNLYEGDIIEIGDALLRFTFHPMDYQLSETAAIQKPRMSVV